MKRLLKPTNPALNLRSQELSDNEFGDEKTKSLLDNMLKISGQYKVNSTNKSKQKLVGLSAVQIGVLQRVILVCVNAKSNRPTKNPEYMFFINPRITECSKRTNLWKEGCFSTADITGIVRRADWVKIVACDENGNEFTYNSSNRFVARIIQHEIDHLDGVRFPSRVTRPDYLHIVEKEDRPLYKKGWRNWNKICPIESWMKMYNGKEQNY